MSEDDGFCFCLLPKDTVLPVSHHLLSLPSLFYVCLSPSGPATCFSPSRFRLPPISHYLDLPPVSHYRSLSPIIVGCRSLSVNTTYHFCSDFCSLEQTDRQTYLSGLDLSIPVDLLLGNKCVCLSVRPSVSPSQPTEVRTVK